ncbi:Asp-tRNA(Asn)/Glu-tRNA(Gln) amidotransferase subunit GatB [Candidatus Kaiserbacteria bacterium CG10_big_fil_rev_8_21_14_0_10_59_10]|uniref:Aspartyl/glutamyl-tRNA(Asn/Gln) amidotransferase subunit B n=1 Tax=Candidatus Kaiserbacteria bacterium CG10_big_fil_rev_8_21_14_0_10_59_10 TaxID=1974612 RepID=A0A2H0U7N9_9BACT|nr:MAG: Asp-tRNA(Asn)/Glu-tRNA(Gln) amidotransferase subunit GatB [Candidatus Kaiserbacteria bacterium CG10_big_fil_rev_8_21_14_0_10_59_10]
MSEYRPTIGLEIHAELKTRTKMFCSSKNDTREVRPNVNVCPVCMAHPGTLPVVNREAVRHVLRVGVAVGGTLADYTEFDRKNYFYPDLPKGYQISQYEHPLVSGGELAGVALTRIHLEEDTASSMHDESTGETLIDYNRAGVPLMELVTEPVIGSAEQAGEFARELQLLLRYLGASDAEMERGEMRVEANISVSSQEAVNGARHPSGTKVEIKNLNSFNAMERAVRYEIERQTALLEKGESVPQETRGWDEKKQATFTQRVKEVSADYRYFPDPDLPSLRLSELPDFAPEDLRRTLQELPWQRYARYVALGIKESDAKQYVRDPLLGGFVDKVVGELQDRPNTVALASNYIANDLANIIRDFAERDTEIQSEIPIVPADFAELVRITEAGEVSSRGAKDVLREMVRTGKDPVTLATQLGLFKMQDNDALLAVVRRVLEENSSVAADYAAGKEAALMFLVGKGMAATKGAADPELLKKILVEEIQKGSHTA